MFKFICFITVLNNSGLTGDDFKYIYTNKNMVLDFCKCKISRRCGFFYLLQRSRPTAVFSFLLFTFMKHSTRECCSVGDGIRIIFHALDPGSVPGCLGSGSIWTITTKLTGRENLTKYAFWLGPIGPVTGKIKLRCLKKSSYCFRYITSLKR
jgi:hypothetical protein